MTNTTEMRPLSAEEIGAVAGGSSTNTITVTQSNVATAMGTSGTATVTSNSGVSTQPWHPHGHWY